MSLTGKTNANFEQKISIKSTCLPSNDQNNHGSLGNVNEDEPLGNGYDNARAENAA